jgi:FkbM family methyltransferase
METNGEYFFLRSELPKIGGVVFDVGANVGNWASFVLDINPKINLHCFEPSKATYAKLAQKEWPSNVRLNNLGLGEVEGVLELNVVDEESALNSLYLRRGVDCARAVKTEKISITTIDDYCEKNAIQRIDLIKVDVEGHELAVFKGMRQMLAQGFVLAIQFEYGGCNLDAKVYLGDIWEFLEPYGFKFYKLYPEGPRHIENFRQKLETFQYSNWVAIHKSHDSV